MSTRTGLSTNEIEIDKRFDDLQTLIESKLDSNPESGTPAQRAQSITLPQVTGIRTNNQIVGAISFEWNAVTISPILFYDVQVSSVENFVQISTKSYKVTGQTYIILPDVAPESARYARVRVTTTSGSGPWSSTLNTQSGKAVPNQLIVGASTNIVRHVQTTFDPPELNATQGPQVGSYGYIDIETIGGVVIIFSTIQFYLSWFTGMSLGITLREDGNEILSFQNYVQSSPADGGAIANSTGIQSFPGMAIPSSPPPGIHTYNWEIVLQDIPPVGAGSYGVTEYIFIPLNITTAIVELRR